MNAFEKRFDEIIKKIPSQRLKTAKLWVWSLVFSAIVWGLVYLYIWQWFGEPTSRVLNDTFADAGFLLIGFSFALSGICYFWDFLDTKIIYRKYLGLIGFFSIIVHAYLSIFNVPFPFSSYFSTARTTTAFSAAAIALLIFFGMALISNRYAVTQLGGKRWRMALRVGYVAYLLALVHFVMRKWDAWGEWMTEKDPSFPPFGMIVLAVGVVVVLLRFALQMSLMKKKDDSSS